MPCPPEPPPPVELELEVLAPSLEEDPAEPPPAAPEVSSELRALQAKAKEQSNAKRFMD